MDLLPLAEAARMTGLAPQTLKLQAQRGRLGARKLGGIWVTSIEDVMRYVASRRVNAADVHVVCLDCDRIFFTPRDAVRVGPGSTPGLLGCPDCRSQRMRPAAVQPDPYGPVGHRLGGALRRALDDARSIGDGESEVNDLTHAYVNVRVLGGPASTRVEFDVDRDGSVDDRDSKRLRDHVQNVVGEVTDEETPRAVYRYVFVVGRTGRPATDRPATKPS
jgi:hypothetical protein